MSAESTPTQLIQRVNNFVPLVGARFQDEALEARLTAPPAVQPTGFLHASRPVESAGRRLAATSHAPSALPRLPITTFKEAVEGPERPGVWTSSLPIYSNKYKLAGLKRATPTLVPTAAKTFRKAKNSKAKKSQHPIKLDSVSPLTWTLPSKWNNIEEAFQVDRWVWGTQLAKALPDVPAFVDSSNASVLSVEYPKGSIDPGAPIKGGVGFYMAPLDLSKANNVSFSFSIFFPTDFDFQKGGKLPGLYGGHGGCSGGNAATTCFSTRLMFRQDGKGELYLYAPVGSQPKSVCNLPPYSTCSADFGASLGRGSWTFARGNWTTVKQDIWLNTPGKADGGFNIWANGERVLTADNVYFRNSPGKRVNKAVTVKAANAVIAQDGLMEDLVDNILDDRLNTTYQAHDFMAGPVSFAGVMFQSFFGGHEPSYASPKTQQVYINNVALSINS